MENGPHSPGHLLVILNSLCRQRWDKACLNRGLPLRNAFQRLWWRMWVCREGRRAEREAMAEATVSSSGPRRHLVWVEKPGSDRWLAPSPPQLPDHPGCFRALRVSWKTQLFPLVPNLDIQPGFLPSTEQQGCWLPQTCHHLISLHKHLLSTCYVPGTTFTSSFHFTVTLGRKW